MAHILVVEDEPLAAQALARLLARDGHRTSVAADGREALARFAADPAELVVTDLRMPEMDGLLLVQELLAVQPFLPILVTTGFPDDARALGSLRAAVTVLRKPLDPEAVRALVGRELAARGPGVHKQG
ncbi:MAG TPA: response regulator [Azospirillaceae bacterium]|nr:response regulator [Azospirillaceae bacterium]